MRRLPAVPVAGRSVTRGRDGVRVSSVVPLNWYAVVLAVAAASAWILTFPARRIAVQIGYVAQPDDRKVHQRATP